MFLESWLKSAYSTMLPSAGTSRMGVRKSEEETETLVSDTITCCWSLFCEDDKDVGAFRGDLEGDRTYLHLRV